jgi:hypothetical protein
VGEVLIRTLGNLVRLGAHEAVERGCIVKRRGRRFWITAGIAALNAAAAIALGLGTAGAIELDRWVVVLAVVVASVTGVVGSAVAAFREYRGASVEELQRKFATTLRVTLCTIAVRTRIGTCDLGIAVWTVRRRPPLVGRKVLRPVFRQRAAYGTGPSQVDWRPGKGTHGICVATGQYIWRDLGADAERYGQVSDEDWHTVPAEVRQGLKIDEFRRAVGRYRFAAAAPMVQQVGDQEEIVGCVMLDVPRKGGATRLTPNEIAKLTARAVEEDLKGAAGVVVNYLP